MRKIQALFLLTFIATRLWAALSEAPYYKEWMKKSTEELMALAQQEDANSSPADTTLTCLTIISSRYHADMSRQEQAYCAQAYVGLCEIYFHEYFNYPKCFECLQIAQKIADSNGFKMPEIHLGWGCMYQTLAEENDNPEWGEKAFDHYRKAFQLACETGEDRRSDMAFTNVLSMAFKLDKADQIETDWKQYAQLPLNNPTKILRQYNRLLYQIEKQAQEGRIEEAIQLTDQQLQLIQGTEYERLLYFTQITKSRLYAKLGDKQQAIASLQISKEIAERIGMKDGMLETYGMLARLYDEIGEIKLKSYFQELYYRMKDTLTCYRQVASVKELEMHDELREMQRQVEEKEAHRKAMGQALNVAIVFLTTVIVFLVIVFLQNRKLRRSARSLYRKNVEMLKAEEEQRNLREQIEEEKYKRSNLDDNEKERLVKHIREVMESEEIFSPDFSVERLAFLVQSKYKYVSQVIHEQFNCNFNNYLNEYRIKEACKRMGDSEQYGRLTIEAISQSVGFKSRSTFVSSFKRITGLTPSEYQKLSKDRENDSF